MPDPRPSSPGDLLRHMKKLADEAGITLEPGMQYRDLVARSEQVETILSTLFNRIWSDLHTGKIPDLKFNGEDAEWLRKAMHSDASFQDRYNQTLTTLAKEGIALDFEEAGWDDETNSEWLQVVVAPTAELDEEAGPRPSM